MSIYETVEPETMKSYKCFEVYYDADGNAPDSDALISCATKELANAAKKIMETIKKDKMVSYGGFLFDGGPSPYVEGYEWACSFQIQEGICSHVPARNVSEVLEIFDGDPEENYELEGLKVVPLEELVEQNQQ